MIWHVLPWCLFIHGFWLFLIKQCAECERMVLVAMTCQKAYCFERLFPVRVITEVCACLWLLFRCRTDPPATIWTVQIRNANVPVRNLSEFWTNTVTIVTKPIQNEQFNCVWIREALLIALMHIANLFGVPDWSINPFQNITGYRAVWMPSI